MKWAASCGKRGPGELADHSDKGTVFVLHALVLVLQFLKLLCGET